VGGPLNEALPTDPARPKLLRLLAIATFAGSVAVFGLSWVLGEAYPADGLGVAVPLLGSLGAVALRRMGREQAAAWALVLSLVVTLYLAVWLPADVVVGVLLVVVPVAGVLLLGTRAGQLVAVLASGAVLFEGSLRPDPMNSALGVLAVVGASWGAWRYERARQLFARAQEVRALELAAARDRAEEASRLKTRFLANISHEIRTPMNGVLGVARILQEGELDWDQRTGVDTIVESGESLLTLLNDLLDLSKVESGHLVLAAAPFEPLKLVEEVASLFAERAHRRGLELVTLVDHGVPASVRGDATRVRQILANLVSNAVKFTEVGEVVISATWHAGRGLTLAVRDTGVGVPDALATAIFEPFVEGDAYSETRGTGLGLAVSRDLARAMGGELRLESGEGLGARFVAQLPLAEVTPASSPDGSAGSALVVSAEPLVRRMVADAVQRLGWSTEERPTLDRDAVRGHDAVLVDVRVPDPHHLASVQLARWSDAADVHTRVVRLPVRTRALQAALSGTVVPTTTEELAPVAGERARVLVVEDNPVNQMVARRMLEVAGHEVAVAQDGRDGVDAVRREAWDLILMDVQMPGMDGIEATQTLRGEGVEVPIVALTGLAMAAERERCLIAGMDEVLTKPVEPGSLRRMVQRALLGTLRRPGASVVAESADPTPGAW
jgi:signal transduction histidine kinase/CheY-like chemotaxis protein